MKLMHYTEQEPKRIETDVAKGVLARLLIGKDDGAKNFCMRLFQLDKDGHTPCHRHTWEHEIFFHQGQGEIYLGDTWKPVSEGCAAFVPGDLEHQIRNTGDSILSFVCLIPSGYPEL